MDGIFKKIIAGVATAVLTAVALHYLSIDKKGSKVPEAQVQTQTSETEALRRKQADLEARLQRLSAGELQQRQAKLERQIEEAEVANQEQPYTRPASSLPDIGGMWRDPNSGATYQFTQDGAFFTLQELSWGTVTAAGQGTLDGRTARFTYTTVFGTNGSGTMRISPDNLSISSTFTDHVTQMTMNSVLYR